MDKLEKLMQDEMNTFLRADGTAIKTDYVAPVGEIKTLVVQNPCLDISNVLDEMAKRDAAFIPSRATAYVASDFNGDTQYSRDEKMYSVYAIQFYNIAEAFDYLDL